MALVEGVCALGGGGCVCVWEVGWDGGAVGAAWCLGGFVGVGWGGRCRRFDVKHL